MHESRAALPLWTYYWVFVLLLYLPLVVLAVFSLHGSPVLSLPWRGFSTRWYEAIAETSQLTSALANSITIGLASSALALVLGAMTAIAVTRFAFRGRLVLLAVALTPLVMPYLALAVALLLTFLAIGIRPSFFTVVVGHSLLGLPAVVLLLSVRLIGLEDSLEDAAMDLGAGWLRMIRRVHLPLLRPALVAAFITAFVISFNEFYLAVFLAGGDTTLPVYFYSGFRSPDILPPTLALSTLVTALLLVVVAMTETLARRGGLEPDAAEGSGE